MTYVALVWCIDGRCASKLHVSKSSNTTVEKLFITNKGRQLLVVESTQLSSIQCEELFLSSVPV